MSMSGAVAALGIAVSVGYLGWKTTIVLVLGMIVIVVRRERNKAGGAETEANLPRKFTKPVPEKKHLTTRDGLKIHYYVVKGQGFGSGSGKVMLLAPPLGQCGFSIYYPIMAKFGDQYTYITWDYRGLFSSDTPARIRRISIPMHAEDGIEVLKEVMEGWKREVHPSKVRADIMVGHSMGVQVCLETVVIYPEHVDSLILLNGAHGHVFSSGFQPLFRVPVMGNIPYWIVQLLLSRPDMLRRFQKVMKPAMDIVLPLWGRWFGSKLLKELLGERYLLDFVNDYLGSILDSPTTLMNYLFLFQELDAHSVYHLLRQNQPATPNLILIPPSPHHHCPYLYHYSAPGITPTPNLPLPYL